MRKSIQTYHIICTQSYQFKWRGVRTHFFFMRIWILNFQKVGSGSGRTRKYGSEWIWILTPENDNNLFLKFMIYCYASFICSRIMLDLHLHFIHCNIAWALIFTSWNICANCSLHSWCNYIIIMIQYLSMYAFNAFKEAVWQRLAPSWCITSEDRLKSSRAVYFVSVTYLQ